MSMYWDKKRDKRLISFLYNSNLFTGISFNDNLEIIINQTNNSSFPFIDNRINSIRLDEMDDGVNNIINNSITALINRQQIIQNGLLSSLIIYISNRPIYVSTPLTRSNIDDILIKELTHYFHRNTLKDDDFNWISIDNPRVVNFVWASLRNSYFHLTKNNVVINFDLENSYTNIQQTAYQAMNLEINPPDLKNKIESIKLFFDSWGEPLFSQKNLMASIKSKWDKIKNRLEIIEWLNKNEEITTWSWSYIIENMLNKSNPAWVNISSTDKKDIEQQTKDSIITFYDLLDRETDKKLLKSQLSKNGSQQKYRIKEKQNTRALNINISTETKENLEKLKKIKNRSMKEIIEDLINDEFNKISIS